MSIPAGYVPVEYIESTGTQYIDTGCIPSSGLMLEINLEPNSSGVSEHAIFGSAWSANGFFLMFYQGKIRWHSRGASVDVSDYNTAGRNDIVCTQASISVNGAVYGLSGTGADSSNTILLFGNPTLMGFPSGKAGIYKLFCCRIYDGSAIIRDFVPVKDQDGVGGLYDLANSKFYANNGSGSFLAGPEIKTDIDTPAGFAVSEQDEESALLVWEAVESAAGYRLYRNGVLILETNNTQARVPVGLFSVADFAVSAYTDSQESEKAQIRVYSVPASGLLLYLIYNRTPADVAAGNALGTYNAADINRVSEVCNYIGGMFASYGYHVPETLRTDWKETDIPRKSDMEKYIRVIRTLSGLVRFMPVLPDLPQTMERFGFGSANAIEEMLYHLGRMAEKIPSTWFQCGMTESGVIYR